MRFWTYEIRDNRTGTLLSTASGFLTESDAELQGNMDAKADGLKGYHIRTFDYAQEEEKQ